MTQKIVPYLWFDKEAKEAADYYANIFNDSTRPNITEISIAPESEGAVVVDFKLYDINFVALSGGPYFKFNHSTSLLVYCENINEINSIWGALIVGGLVVIPLMEYPFNKLCGWIEDNYGLSWQIMHVNKEPKQKIKAVMTFSDGVCGKAEEAIHFYTEIFENSKIVEVRKYQEGQASSKDAKVSYAEFTLNGMEFLAMDDNKCGDHKFNEAVSFMVLCDNQKEVDYYWEALSAVPESEQCGWLKDKFGFSWQIIPVRFNEMMSNGTDEQIKKVTESFLKMKRFDIETLEKAYSL